MKSSGSVNCKSLYNGFSGLVSKTMDLNLSDSDGAFKFDRVVTNLHISYWISKSN